ncbi:hypothetical protein [Saccharothrix obliqua]|uniref:hypothetical protein n=1 Tax=Saccharothrix obliqua TaxID=2861747 RepID=UPI001C5F74B5|nr:hypothetical protein [Saccharothrix obliqua]MBW4718156.1 hypothetical protein [Saccharothrix obliqua]
MDREGVGVLAVLMGGYRGTALPDVVAARHSVQALRGVLTGRPGTRVEVPAAGPRSAGAIAALLGEPADRLLLYYAGHARLTDDGDVLLGLPDSDPDDVSTWLRFADVRASVRAHGAPGKVVVLDCCFTDGADNADSVDDLADRVERATRVDGARTLVFCLASREAVYDDRANGLTYLGHALVRALSRGADVTAAADDPGLRGVHAGRLRPTPAVEPVATAEPNPAVEGETVAARDVEPVRFRVSVPRSVVVYDRVALVAVAAMTVWIGSVLGVDVWAFAMMTLVAARMMESEVHVPWWRWVRVGDELTLHRGRGVAAFVKRGLKKELSLDWRHAGVERVVVGRVGSRSRVNLHVSPDAAARLWNVVPFTGFGGYRYGLFAHGARGLAWPLGDVHAPAEEVAEAFRAAVPAGVDVAVVLNAEPPYRRARRWVLVFYLLFFGSLLLGVSVVG